MPDGLPVRTLREWRRNVFFESQLEFAKRLGVDVSTLSLWENGHRHPRFSTIRHIADKLGLKPQQLDFDAKGDD